MSLQLLLFWASCLALFLLPGALVARSIPVLWSRLSPGERLLPAFLLSAGYLGLVWVLGSLIRPTVDFSLGLWAAGCVILIPVTEWWRRRTGASARRRTPLPPPAGNLALLAALALCGISIWATLHEGGSLGYIHDSLDFVSFVRRMLETGRIDIVSAAYRNTEGMGPDPRRGAFHLGMAMVCAASGIAPDAMWRSLPVVLVPLSLWIFFASTRRILESAPAAAFALLFFVGTTLFEPDRFLQNLAYASRLGWVYSWVGVWAVALGLDADRTDKSRPPDWSRHARAVRGLVGRGALVLAVLGAPILVAVHVLSAVQYLISLAAFCWTWALSRREPRPLRRRLALLPLAAGAALVPALFFKVMGSYSAANPIFDHPQGLLYLWDQVPLLAPQRMAAWFGWPGLLAVLLVIPMFPRVRVRRDFAYVVSGTVIGALILLNPLAVMILERFKAHSLLFRVLFVVPHFATLGIYTAWSLRRLRDDRPSWRWAAPIAFLALIGLFLTFNVREATRFFSEPAFRRGPWMESQPLRRALAFLSESESEPRVVASDPITSYQIPAYSRHYAIAPFNQHSSPADDRAVERIYDALAILNAYVPMDRTLRLLRDYRVDYVLVNQSFPRYVKFYYTFIAPEAWPGELAKFTQLPEVFEPVYSEDGIHLFRFHDPGPGFHYPPPRNPYVMIPAEEAGALDRATLATRLGVEPASVPPIEGLEMIGVAWTQRTFTAGDYVKIRSYWRRTGPPPTLPVEAFFRLATDYPSPLFENPWFGKPYRRFYEKKVGLTYRFGRLHEPLEESFPTFLWEPGAVYWDEFWIPAPRHAAPGEYQVAVKLYEVPYAPNYYLTDFLRVNDSLEGVEIGRVELVPPRD
ncbi:MAG: hypothetical protein KC729_09085 [Candidatus Eisenbacteria bacterium]|uniref:Uncharacterized protein n=1 Tax=Eiseniibacteriota bacterium TaxID=2212470 RepID=A0A956LZ10_UNCEI|nr:hypothetical protein [Candidatus Eisenbacteria bacterium]